MPKSYLHYEVIEKLGQGGMGVVYLAVDKKLNRKVALKFLPDEVSTDPDEQRRFKQEASAAAQLNHPNIAQVFAIEEDKDKLFIVMEYVQGRGLDELIYESAPTMQEKEDIAKQIAEGLKAAHDHDILHRDIKSSNIMITDSGLVKVMDFGLARIQGTTHITKPGTTLGTTSYMSPEQVNGNECDLRSDIWSFGVVLHELFTGELPFKGAYEPAILYAIMEDELDMGIIETQHVPLYMQNIISGCLVKEKGERYQDLQAVIDGIETKKNEVLVSKRGLESQAEDSSKKMYTVVALAVAVVLTLGLIFQDAFPVIFDNLPEKKFLAVLPIEIIGDSPYLTAISDGLSETFSYRLSSLEKHQNSYWVTPASEMRRENIRSATLAKKMFGINLAILSSLQSVNDSTRFTIELVDADNMRRIDTKQIVIASDNLAILEVEGVKVLLNMLNIDIDNTINETLSRGDPSIPEAYEYYLKGVAALQDNSSLDSLEKAITLFKEAVELDSEFALAYAGLGESYWYIYQANKSAEYLEKAEKELKRSLMLNEDLAQVQSSYGLLKTGTGEYEQAVQYFNRALENDNRYTPAYRGLAEAYDKLGKTEQAIATYQKAIDLKPDYWESYKDLGVHYLRKGNFKAAIDQFQKVIKITPSSSTAYSNLGVAYYYNGDMKKAREMFENSLALEKNPITANNLAGLYYWEGNFARAANMYEIALNAYSDRYEIWGNLAAAYELSGSDEKARKAYQTAIAKGEKQLEVNPNDAFVLANLGAYYSDIGDRTTALSYIKRALEINEENIMIRQRAVAAYEKLGMRQEALNWITAAMISDLELQPEFQKLINDPEYQALKENFNE